MDDESIFRLKKKFRETFPVHAQLLDLAKSQDEIDGLHTRFMDEANQNVIKSMKEAGVSDDGIKNVIGDKTNGVPAIMLTNAEFEELGIATGKEIENKIHALMDGLQRLKNMKGSDDHGMFIAGMVLVGIVAFNGLAYARVANFLVERVYTSIGSLMFGAMTRADASVFYLKANLAIAIIFAVLLPILHFTDKSANCVVVVINETDKPLYLVEDHNVHGNVNGQTYEFPAAVTSTTGEFFPSAGFMVSVKTKSALVGTQYGFRLRLGKVSDPDPVDNITFGVESPLTAMYKDNNCYCGFNASAEDAAKKTDKHNKQTYTETKHGIELSIKCNSKSGSTAYYIARVRPTP